jgi:rhodanese-related sulfurtransferase
MREVPLAAFAAAHSDGAIVVDVREPGEYVGGHVPGAALVPMGQLSSRLHDLSPRTCRSISSAAAAAAASQ